MKILAWGLLVVALLALGAVWLLGSQARTQVNAANYAAEQLTQRQIDDLKNNHRMDVTKKTGSLDALTKRNGQMEDDIAKLDADIAESQAKIDAAGNSADNQERVDLITQVVRLRDENDGIRQEIKARGGN